MSDVVSQLEAVIAGIEARTEHTKNCATRHTGHGIYMTDCNCDLAVRVRTEIARTVARMIREAAHVGFRNCRRADESLPMLDIWAAAFRATQETQK